MYVCNACMDGWMDGSMDVWMYGCMYVWMYGCNVMQWDGMGWNVCNLM